MKFQEFKVGQTFKSRILIDKDDFQKYISFAKTKNILHEKPELAAKEGIKGTLLPGRAIIARAEIVWIKREYVSVWWNQLLYPSKIELVWH